MLGKVEVCIDQDEEIFETNKAKLEDIALILIIIIKSMEISYGDLIIFKSELKCLLSQIVLNVI